MSFQPKASNAVRLWVVIVIGVLIVLFIEMQSSRHMDTFNFVIASDSDDVGAEVFVDKQKIGMISNSTPEGPGGGFLMSYLPRGKHVVEVRKEGFKPYNTEIDMHREHYLGVDLQPLSN